MGVVNVTPDSFSDGGDLADVEAAVASALRLYAEGAAWVDIGGESSRPGAAAVEPHVEAARVVPVIAALHAVAPQIPVSVDTRRAAVAERALAAGASMVNDITAGRDPDMIQVVRASRAQFVLMHMRGEPTTMQRDTVYDDVVGEVGAWLSRRASEVLAAGVPADRIWLDPGLGFGKASADNPRLLRCVAPLAADGWRVVVGASRKRFVGELTGVARPADRVHGSVGVALAAATHGAAMVRVHDVAATIQALRTFAACVDAPDL